MSSTPTKPGPVTDEYRALLGHAIACPTCNAASDAIRATCKTGARLRRAEREGRR